ncbi:hypothetical protein CM15mP5_3890 [bacterium]|nr:MAG: hypothetical protein CM15mP5_3890 [bacterium]
MMIFVNHALTLESLNDEVLKKFLIIILNPFAPHISEEIYEILEYNVSGAISSKSWPIYDQNYLTADTVKIVVQINGKTRGVVNLESNLNEKDIIEYIINDNNYKKYFLNMKIKKEIYIPNRLLNFVLK